MPARVERFHMTSRRPYCSHIVQNNETGVMSVYQKNHVDWTWGLNSSIMQKRFFFGLKTCIAFDHVSENDLLLHPHLRRVFRLDEELVTWYGSKLSIGNFILARDQVVYLETAGNLKNQSDWASNFPTSFPWFSPTRPYVPGTGRREPWERGW